MTPRTPRPGSTRRRFIGSVLASFAIGVAAIVAIIGVRLHWDLDRTLDHHLVGELTEFAEIAAKEPHELEIELRHSAAEWPVVAAADAAGQVTFRHGCTADELRAWLRAAPDGGATAWSIAVPAAAQRPPLRVSVRASAHGTFVLGADASVVLAANSSFWWTAVATGLLASLMLLVWVWSLTRRVFRPIAQMTQAAARISGENLDDRVPIAGDGDELDRLALFLNSMIDRLATDIERQRRFNVSASHELRTPLAAARLALEDSLRAPADEDREAGVLVALGELSRLQRLVSELLRQAKQEREPALRRPVEVTGLLAEAVEELRAIADARAISLAGPGGEAVWIDGVADQLRQCAVAVLDNALRYAEAGGTVSAATSRHGGTAHITVRNTGLTPSPEDCRRAFEPFYRGPAARAADAEGLGIGLGEVARIVARHDGEVVLRPGEAGGAVLEISLPTRESEPVEAAATADAPAPEPAAANGVVAGPR